MLTHDLIASTPVNNARVADTQQQQQQQVTPQQAQQESQHTSASASSSSSASAPSSESKRATTPTKEDPTARGEAAALAALPQVKSKKKGPACRALPNPFKRSSRKQNAARTRSGDGDGGAAAGTKEDTDADAAADADAETASVFSTASTVAAGSCTGLLGNKTGVEGEKRESTEDDGEGEYSTAASSSGVQKSEEKQALTPAQKQARRREARLDMGAVADWMVMK